jgi:SAM-dependent methyltransferase
VTSGTGRGSITPDGCPVEVYSLVPPLREPDTIHSAIPQGAAVLELGCGAGRITHSLIELGHPVTAVDESRDMLRRVRGADTVQSRIEDLSLPRRFPAVVLASGLINSPGARRRRDLLASCRRHVEPDGQVLIQRETPEWFDSADESSNQLGEVTARLKVTRRQGTLLWATVEYLAQDEKWTHSFTAERLDDTEIRTALAEAGLTLQRWLTPDRAWLAATPVEV